METPRRSPLISGSAVKRPPSSTSPTRLKLTTAQSQNVTPADDRPLPQKKVTNILTLREIRINLTRLENLVLNTGQVVPKSPSKRPRGRPKRRDLPISPTKPRDPPISPAKATDPPVSPAKAKDPPISPAKATDPRISPAKAKDPPIFPAKAKDPPISPAKAKDPPVSPPNEIRPIPSPDQPPPLTNSLPVSILTSRLPRHTPPTFPSVGVHEFEMAMAEIIEISDDDDIHVRKPRTQKSPTAPAGPPNPPVVDFPPSNPVETQSTNQNDFAAKVVMPQEEVATASSSPELAEESLENGVSGVRKNISATDPIEDSEEIVVSVSAESILAMDQEVETPTSPKTVANCPVPVRSTNTAAVITPLPTGEGINEGQRLNPVSEFTQADPPINAQHLQQLRRIQKPSTGSSQSAAQQRLHTHTCYICLKTMATHHEFQSHLLAHPLNKCPDCGKVVSSYKQLKGHVVRKIQKGMLREGGSVSRGRNSKLSNQPKAKCPPVPQAMAPPQPPPGTVQLSNGNGHVLPSSSTSWQETDYMDSETSPGRERTMSNDFDEVFPPHFMDMESILDVEKLKDNFDIIPLPASQFDNSTSGMVATSTWQSQFPGANFPGTVQHGCGLSAPLSICPATVATPPAPAYGIGRRQHLSTNQAHPSSNYYPPIPYGNQLRTSLQNPSNSTLTNGVQFPWTSFAAASASTPVVPPSSTTTRIPFGTPVSVVSNGDTGEFKSYKDLLAPLSKMKQFGMEELDGPIVYTIHELEKHVMTQIMSMSTSTKNSPN